MPDNFKYWAFISYSHADAKWGTWLHRQLETYRFPAKLAGRSGPDGEPVPSRLFPVFRDREELPTAVNLGEVISSALRTSRSLVVICSPRSAKSRWVNEEIRSFKAMGRAHRVLCLIVDGEPNASDGKPGFKVEDECFPEAVRFHVDLEGNVTDQRTEPIAADARPGKDGPQVALLKLLAGLSGVGFDELAQRDQQRRIRQLQLRLAFAAVIGCLILASAVYAFIQRNTAIRAERQTAEALSLSQLREADRLLGEGDTQYAMAYLAQALRTDPENHAAAAIIWNQLTTTDWWVSEAAEEIPAGAQLKSEGGLFITWSKQEVSIRKPEQFTPLTRLKTHGDVVDVSILSNTVAVLDSAGSLIRFDVGAGKQEIIPLGTRPVSIYPDGANAWNIALDNKSYVRVPADSAATRKSPAPPETVAVLNLPPLYFITRDDLDRRYLFNDELQQIIGAGEIKVGREGWIFMQSVIDMETLFNVVAQNLLRPKLVTRLNGDGPLLFFDAAAGKAALTFGNPGTGDYHDFLNVKVYTLPKEQADVPEGAPLSPEVDRTIEGLSSVSLSPSGSHVVTGTVTGRVEVNETSFAWETGKPLIDPKLGGEIDSAVVDSAVTHLLVVSQKDEKTTRLTLFRRLNRIVPQHAVPPIPAGTDPLEFYDEDGRMDLALEEWKGWISQDGQKAIVRDPRGDLTFEIESGKAETPIPVASSGAPPSTTNWQPPVTAWKAEVLGQSGKVRVTGPGSFEKLIDLRASANGRKPALHRVRSAEVSPNGEWLILSLLMDNAVAVVHIPTEVCVAPSLPLSTQVPNALRGAVVLNPSTDLKRVYAWVGGRLHAIECPLPDYPAASWLPELAEAFAGYRIDRDGKPEALPPGEFERFRSNITSGTETERKWEQWAVTGKL